MRRAWGEARSRVARLPGPPTLRTRPGPVATRPGRAPAVEVVGDSRRGAAGTGGRRLGRGLGWSSFGSRRAVTAGGVEEEAAAAAAVIGGRRRSRARGPRLRRRRSGPHPLEPRRRVVAVRGELGLPLCGRRRGGGARRLVAVEQLDRGDRRGEARRPVPRRYDERGGTTRSGRRDSRRRRAAARATGRDAEPLLRARAARGSALGRAPRRASGARRGRPRGLPPAAPIGRARRSVCRRNASRNGCSATRPWSSPTSSPSTPAARSRSIRSSRVGEPELLRADGSRSAPTLVGEVGERIAAPELERFAQLALAAKTFEGRGVQLVLIDADEVARPPEQTICPKNPPQPRNEDVEVVGRFRRRLVAPKRLDQDVFGNRRFG